MESSSSLHENNISNNGNHNNDADNNKAPPSNFLHESNQQSLLPVSKPSKTRKRKWSFSSSSASESKKQSSCAEGIAKGFPVMLQRRLTWKDKLHDPPNAALSQNAKEILKAAKKKGHHRNALKASKGTIHKDKIEGLFKIINRIFQKLISKGAKYAPSSLVNNNLLVVYACVQVGSTGTLVKVDKTLKWVERMK